MLMNAIYLWACYLSRSGSLGQYEQLYLSRTLAALSDAMQYMSKALDLIQACCMLSVYYLSNGRLLEGSYYSAAACTLAVQCRLHQISPDGRSMNSDGWDASFDLPPPKDNVERGERISTFWQVFNLDRCWSVVLRRPATLPESDHPMASITTPWPQRIADYENVSNVLVRRPVKRSLSTASRIAGGPRLRQRLAHDPRILRATRTV